MRLIAVRLLAVLFALTWLVLPGFGLIDLGVTWDPEWPVVLEASWGVFMTVLVGGSFVAIAVRPAHPAPAVVALGVALAALALSTLLGLEAPLLVYVALLAVQGAMTAALLRGLPGREPVHPRGWSIRWPLLVVGALGVVPWLVHAERMFASNRAEGGLLIDELTMGVDHYAVQGGLAVALAVLALLAAGWPRGRQYLGVCVGLCAGYLGLVSFAFPGTAAGLDQLWSVLCMAWGLVVAALALPAGRSEQRELGGEVVEAQRTL